MKPIIEMLEAFIAAEYNSAIAYHVEQSAAAAAAAARTATDYMHITPGNAMSVQPSGRYRDLSDDKLDKQRQALHTYGYAPRTWFLLEHRRHGELGDVYFAYVSPMQSSDLPAGYSSRWGIRCFDGAPKIFSIATVNPFSRSRSTTRIPWTHHQGVRLESLGELIAVRKNQPPERDRDRAHYDSL